MRVRAGSGSTTTRKQSPSCPATASSSSSTPMAGSGALRVARVLGIPVLAGSGSTTTATLRPSHSQEASCTNFMVPQSSSCTTTGPFGATRGHRARGPRAPAGSAWTTIIRPFQSWPRGGTSTNSTTTDGFGGIRVRHATATPARAGRD